MDNLKPINGHVLVELADKYEYAATPDVQYATKTSGIVRKLGEDDKPTHSELLNKRVWFKSYEDDVKLGEDDKYTFIKYEDIKGYESV